MLDKRAGIILAGNLIDLGVRHAPADQKKRIADLAKLHARANNGKLGAVEFKIYASQMGKLHGEVQKWSADASPEDRAEVKTVVDQISEIEKQAIAAMMKARGIQ